jgi:hypothetical protein
MEGRSFPVRRTPDREACIVGRPSIPFKRRPRRAFRIGRTKNVQVRKFVCAGTLEERIDEMIERKRQAAESVVETGEAWLTELPR